MFLVWCRFCSSMNKWWALIIKMTLEYYRIFLSLFKQTHPQICCCSATRTRKVTYNLTRMSSTCYAILWNIRLGEFQSLKLSLFNHTCVWVNSRRGKTVCRYRRAKITRGENNPVFSRYSWEEANILDCIKYSN